MDIEMIGSTRPKNNVSKEESLDFCAKIAGECYTEKRFSLIDQENSESTKKRMDLTLSNGHHSVYGHVTLNLEINGLPKILAMILNNEKIYTTSEKSARYTKMNPAQDEKELYDYWQVKLKDKINERYPNIDEKKSEKLAQENARYMISVFTPTNMIYSVDMRQLNYIMHWFGDFIDNAQSSKFNDELKKHMFEFNDSLIGYYVDELNPGLRMRKLSLFSGSGSSKNHFGDTYSTTYYGSFAQLAQAQRHRIIDYSINPIDFEPGLFFIPSIINDDKDLKNKWIEDINSVSQNFPQGTMVYIRERGTYTDFISKCAERLCGQAQLEIAIQTKKTLDKYVSESRQYYPEIHDALLPYSNGPRCTFPDYSCTSPCTFGKKGLERLI